MAGRDQEGPNIPAALEQGWVELARELDFPATSCSHRQVRALLRNKDGSMAPKLYQRQGPTATWNESKRPWVQLATDWRIWLCIFQYIWLFFKKTPPKFKLPVRLRTTFTTRHAGAELKSGGFTGGLDNQWDTLGLILGLGYTVETASCSAVSTPHPAS